MSANEDKAGAGNAPDVQRRADGRLVLRRSGEEDVPVQAVPCFPWSLPRGYVSLRDDKGHELTLVERLDDLPVPVRSLIEEELALRNFVPRITAVESVTAQAELFHWRVRTAAGPRSFLTPRHEYYRGLGGGRGLIKDVANDLYLVDGIESLDAASRRWLWVYLD